MHPTLLNLTNHPASTWTEPQREATAAFATRVVDFPFPNVPPSADLGEIEQLADVVLEDLHVLPAFALVNGEPTLAACLVQRLQARGVQCLIATTIRDVQSLPDGKTVRVFCFCRYRAWPSIG